MQAVVKRSEPSSPQVPPMRQVVAAGSAGPLVVRIRNWIGDVVLGLPALQLLQSHGYALTLIARGRWAPVLLAGYDWPVLVQPGDWRTKVAQLRLLRQSCLAGDPGFDRRENALLLPVSLSSALEMRLAGLHAVGFAKEGRSPLLARSLPQARAGHELERYWNLACRFLRVDQGPPRHIGLRVTADKAALADELIRAAGLGTGFVLACPFAAGRAATPNKDAKKWPGFADFIARADAALGLPVVVYPGPGELDEARRHYPAAMVLQGSDLGVYAALLQRARLVVANDTGPAHMAAALGTPLISVLGATFADRWAPWGPRVSVLQQPQAGDHVIWPGVDEALARAKALIG